MKKRQASMLAVKVASRALLAAAGWIAAFAATPARGGLGYDFNDGTLQGWNQVFPDATSPGGIYSLAQETHLGMWGWDGHDTWYARSPAFYLDGSGDLTFTLYGAGSSQSALTVSTGAAVPQLAINDGGFQGMALRRVEDDTFVLDTGMAASSATGFSASQLAPFANDGRQYTLDFINYDQGGWGWIVLDTTAIPGELDAPGTGKDIKAFSVLGVGAAISGTNITQHVPFGTDLMHLAPAVTVSLSATVFPPSGATVDFSAGSVEYTVTASNLATKAYLVTVTVLPEYPVTVNLAYNNSMDGTASWEQKGSCALQVAPMGYAGTTWNDGGDGSAAVNALKDSTGTDTAINVSGFLRPHGREGWGNMGGNKLAGQCLTFGDMAAGDRDIMLEYQDILTLSGLATSHSYNVALAVPNSDGRSASYRHALQEAPAGGANGVTDWVNGQSYALLTNCIPNADGQITIQAKVTGPDWSFLSGWQLLDNGVRALNSEAYLYAMIFPGFGAAVISGTSVAITVPPGTDVTALAPAYTMSVGATCTPASGSAQDFSSPVQYTVVSEDAVHTRVYTMTVNIAPEGPAVINVNITGSPAASMNGVYSSDPVASGSASRVAPAAYGGNAWNDFMWIGSGSSIGGLLNSMGATTRVGLVWGPVFNEGPWADWTGLGRARMLISGKVGSSVEYAPAFTLVGLNTQNKYDLYIASLHNTAVRPADFKVGADEMHVSFAGATDWVAGQNYVRFADLVPPGDGTIVVYAKTPQGVDYSPLNGFQLVVKLKPAVEGGALLIVK